MGVALLASPKKALVADAPHAQDEAEAPGPERQQCLQPWIHGWLRLLGLAFGEQIIEEPGEPDQLPAPAHSLSQISKPSRLAEN